MMSSSIVVEEAQIGSSKKRVATANLAQHRSIVHRVSEKKVQKYFLFVNPVFGASLIVTNSIVTMRSHRGHKM
jgi:hypothetical protein